MCTINGCRKLIIHGSEIEEQFLKLVALQEKKLNQTPLIIMQLKINIYINREHEADSTKY